MSIHYDIRCMDCVHHKPNPAHISTGWCVRERNGNLYQVSRYDTIRWACARYQNKIKRDPNSPWKQNIR
jgi:hypothetical protein